jgi:hypothetical protein
MLLFAIATALCGLAILRQTAAQQFSDRPQPVNYPGISDEWLDALNLIACPGFLVGIVIECVSSAICNRSKTTSNKPSLKVEPALDRRPALCPLHM